MRVLLWEATLSVGRPPGGVVAVGYRSMWSGLLSDASKREFCQFGVEENLRSDGNA